MKRLVLYLSIALLAGALSFAMYQEAREKSVEVPETGEAELAWLRAEFTLNDEQFDEIRRLHADYWPICEALCEEVLESEERLEQAIRTSDQLTPELEAELEQFARVQEECNRHMLRHAYAVASILEPAERDRYISAVRSQITLHGHGH